MIRGVLFDLDRTLLDRDRPLAAFASSQFTRFETRLHGMDRQTYTSALIRLDARGSVWKDLVYQRLVAEFAVTAVTWEELFADFDSRISDFYVPFPNLRSTLIALGQNFRLGLITNGKTEFQSRTIAALRIEEFFPVILISETEGLRKPDPRIFHLALRRMDLASHEAVYVGDHPITDIEAARYAGMRSIWKRNDDFAEVSSDGEIGDLSELVSLLGSLTD